jgi:signal transduction histidine kinase
LRYARVDTAAADLERVDADDVLDDVLGSLSVRIEETGADVEREPLPDVEADPAQLGQVFQNLLANAIEFTEPGQPPSVRVWADRQDGRWRFSVADEGPGMDPREADELFQLFRQGAQDPASESHGIGLAVCKKIVERHGGEIWVDTEPGEGSTFRFTLPAADRREGSP